MKNRISWRVWLVIRCVQHPMYTLKAVKRAIYDMWLDQPWKGDAV